MSLRRASLVILLLGCVALPACKKAKIVGGPDYSRQLPPGAHALRKITDPTQLPDLTQAFNARDNDLLTALDRSAQWYAKSSSRQFFPINDVTHEQAAASVAAFRQTLAEATTPGDFQSRLYRDFDGYISVGWDDAGGMLYTGYYSPVFRASATKTAEFAYPLYRRPPDLVADPVTGEVQGRRGGGKYPSRAEIERSNMLAGTELVWLASRLEAYITQVNGSAKLTMTDGSVRYVGYAGNNGHEYTAIGKLLVEDGKIDRNKLSLPTLRTYFEEHPEELESYINRNARFVFFQDYPADAWPSGSLGVKVTPRRSIATDKTIFPRGSVTMVDTTMYNPQEQLRSFKQFMLDQDTGGAIRAAGRCDLYMGVGETAERMAGRQYAEGRLYYFFLKPERVAEWAGRAKTARTQ